MSVTFTAVTVLGQPLEDDVTVTFVISPEGTEKSITVVCIIICLCDRHYNSMKTVWNSIISKKCLILCEISDVVVSQYSLAVLVEDV